VRGEPEAVRLMERLEAEHSRTPSDDDACVSEVEGVVSDRWVRL
jgi:hypothetical protein